MKAVPVSRGRLGMRMKTDVPPVIDDPNGYCRTCLHQFTNKAAYRYHLIYVHKLDPNLVRRGVRGMIPVIDIGDYNCRSCNRQFLNSSDYNSHLIRVHRIKQKLSQEERKPGVKANFNSGYLYHHCQSCKSRFTSRSHLKKHMIGVHGVALPPLESPAKRRRRLDIVPDADDPNFYCRSCNYKYSSKSSYKTHLVVVHNLKVKAMNLQGNQVSDIPPDVNDPNNYCRTCNREFRSRGEYRIHLSNDHQMILEPIERRGVRKQPLLDIMPDVNDPYDRCRACNFEYASRYNYKSHLIKVHGMKIELKGRRSRLPKIQPDIDDPNYHCKACDIQFSTRREYTQHLLAAHRFRWERKKVLLSTMKKQLVPTDSDINKRCQYCSYQYSTENSYKTHLSTVHEIDPATSRRRKRLSHIVPTDSDVPDKRCQYCDYQYSTDGNYTTHLSTVHDISRIPSRRRERQSHLVPDIFDSNNYCQSCKKDLVGRRRYLKHLADVHEMNVHPHI